MTIKQHGGVFGRNPSFNDVSIETLSIAGAALSSTAAELNILDGVTADATEINYLDGASTSVVTASKAVLANASANIAFASGNGIDFSATGDAGGMTSELLDYYEEGTWTPTLLGSTTNPTQSYLAAATVGRYTKVGNVVIISFRVHMAGSGITSGTGSAQIGGLPFASVNISNLIQGGSISNCSGWGTSVAGAPTNMRLNSSSTTLIDLATYKNDAGVIAGLTSTSAADITNLTNVAGTMIYIAA